MKHSAGTLDLTQGPPLRQLLLFALPLVGGTLFQQLYSLVDTIMVGRFVGVDALAAVGTSYSLLFLTLGFVQGACVGFGIPLAQSFGSGDRAELHHYYWNGWRLAAALAVLLSVFFTVLAGCLLSLTQTPSDIYGQALTYARITFVGIPTCVLYHYSAAALRSVGDSRHPIYFLIGSSALNVLLDWLLIVPFRLGIAGAALATVISQLLGGLLCLWWLHARNDLMACGREMRRFSLPHIRRLCAVGLPMGLEYSVSAIGAVIMQSAINLLGSAAVAAQTTGEKIRQLFTLPMESVGMAASTYVGQNYGAGRIDRIQQGIRAGLCIQAVYSAAAWCVLFAGKRPFVALVLGEASGEVADGALQYLTLISTLFLLHGALMIFRNTLQGMGHSLAAICSGVGELAGRSLGGWLAVTCGSFTLICLSNPMAWGLALCCCVVMVRPFLLRAGQEA